MDGNSKAAEHKRKREPEVEERSEGPSGGKTAKAVAIPEKKEGFGCAALNKFGIKQGACWARVCI